MAIKTKIEDDTPILPHVVAHSVVQELIVGLGKNLSSYHEPVEYLANYADAVYQNNPRFRRKIRGAGDSGRDYLYSFMRHWLSGWIKEHAPTIFSEIPESFRNGLPIPPKVNPNSWAEQRKHAR